MLFDLSQLFAPFQALFETFFGIFQQILGAIFAGFGNPPA